MVWFAYIGMALAFKDESHVSVTFIVSKFPLYLRHITKLIVYALVLCFLVVLFVQSISLLRIVSIQTSPSVQIPMIYPYFSVTVGALLMMIEVIKLMYIFLKDIKK
jgi:TRAP-type C4-dicarboxylate transport system permease small subunit